MDPIDVYGIQQSKSFGGRNGLEFLYMADSIGETLASAVHYTYMREYWVQGRKFPISTGMLIGASRCHRC